VANERLSLAPGDGSLEQSAAWEPHLSGAERMGVDKPKIDFNIQGQFGTDPYFFLRYYATCLILFFVLDVGLLVFYQSNPLHLPYAHWQWLLIPVGCYLGGLSAVFIHNATHGSFRPRWLNRVIGEITGHHQLYGFLGWRTSHIIHHRYPDDPDRDPHPSLHLCYSEFSKRMRTSLSRVLTKNYFDVWPNDRKHRRIWKLKNFCGFGGMLMRLAFWYLLLGPSLFVFLYLPSYAFNYFFFTHFNYFTHRPSPTKNGTFEVHNLDHGPYYTIMNLTHFGIYFHKNHHVKPFLFNPRSLDRKAKESSAQSAHRAAGPLPDPMPDILVQTSANLWKTPSQPAQSTRPVSV
jgi:fatty-acid desaturase